MLAFLFGLVVMALWNWLMPGIFGIRPIAYWEAWGLVLLAHILFKAGRWDHGRGRNDHPRSEDWKERFRRRFKDRSSWSECRDSGDSGDGAPRGRLRMGRNRRRIPGRIPSRKPRDRRIDGCAASAHPFFFSPGGVTDRAPGSVAEVHPQSSKGVGRSRVEFVMLDP